MSTVIRRIAVSGSAAVALLGGAATITVADSSTASATEIQSHIDRATGAPVNLPDGRVMHIRGLDTAGRTATAEQQTAVVSLAAYQADATDPSGITNGITPDNGSGHALQNPLNTPGGTGAVQTGVNDQIVTQAGGGAISITVAMGVGLLIVVIVMVRRGQVKFAQAAMCIALGVYLAPTFVGPLVQQLGGSLGGSLGNVWSSF
ncbi:hypothetical protein ACWD25_17540 [Streptomyces sp. NPDC002920]